MFGKKKEEEKINVPQFDWATLASKETSFFKAVKSLIYEAESQLEANQLELADDILFVVVKHIKRNKFAKKEVISNEESTNLKEE